MRDAWQRFGKLDRNGGWFLCAVASCTKNWNGYNKIDKEYIKCIVVKKQNDRDVVNSIVSSLNINIPVICKNEMF